MYSKDLNGKVVRITSKQQVKENFDTGSGIDTQSWMAWGIPVIVIVLICLWLAWKWWKESK